MLPGNRTAKLSNKAQVEMLLEMRCPKIKIQKHVQSTEHVFISLKDLGNIEQAMKKEKGNNLRTTLDILANKYSEYKKKHFYLLFLVNYCSIF